jgi:HEAT repeat protein
MDADQHQEDGSPRSVPDLGSMPSKYNEQPIERKEDQMPSSDVSIYPGRSEAAPIRESKAGLRLQIERLLHRREAVPVETWQALGEEATMLLVQMLDDQTLQEALRQRVIATLGQLGAISAISQLGDILLNRSESALNRTYAASALGKITDPRVVPLLGRAVTDQNPMVRRQVVRELGRVDQVDAVPYLLILSEDSEREVADLAASKLRNYGVRPGVESERVAPEEDNTYETQTQAKKRPAREYD